MRKMVLLCLMAGFLVSGFALVGLGYRFVSNQEQVRAEIAARLQERTLQSAHRIDEHFLRIQQLATSLAAEITEGRLAKKDIPARLQAAAETNSDLLGVVAAFQPFAFDSGKRLHAPYCVRRQGDLKLVQVEDSYDYTLSKHDWFNLPLTKGAMWQEPFYGQASDSLLAMYCAPFYQVDPQTGDRTLLGVLGITVSLDEVNHIVRQLDIGSVGYGSIISGAGKIICHPVSEYVKSLKPLRELAKESGNGKLLEVLERGARGESGVVERVPTETGRNALLAFSPLRITGWTLLTHSLEDETDAATITRRRQVAHVLFAGLAFAICLACLVALWSGRGDSAYWTLAFVVSALFMGGLCCFWYVAITSNSYLRLPGIKLADKAFLKRYVEVLATSAAERHQENPVLIPTGVYMRSIEMPESHNVQIKGIVWQRYQSGDTNCGVTGFRFPDATSMETREAYREKGKDYETIGWEFVATVPHSFEYNRYPLNRECVTLRISPGDFQGRTVLLPDLDAYKYLTPSCLPGLDPGVRLPGWLVEKSFFEYRKTTSTTTFGLREAEDMDSLPQLCFNVVLKNNVTNSFLSAVTPILVVFALLFAMVMTISRDERFASLMENGMGTMITNGSCLFFIVILSHIEMRAHLISQGLMYLEHFYILQYLTILLICLDAFLFIRFPGIRILQYRDHLVVKLLFCPVCLGVMFLVTALTFY